MKTHFSLTVTTLFLLLITISCNDSTLLKELDSKPNPQTNAIKDVSAADFESVVYEGYNKAGQFVYDHIKKHLATTDPYELLPETQRASMKAKFDSVKSLATTGNGEHWEEALRSKKISQQLHDFLITTDATLKKNILSGYKKSDTDNWFIAKIDEAKKLDPQNRPFAVRYLTIIRYTIRTTYEAVTQPLSSPKARNSNCTVQQINCAAGTIATYAGIGALFGGPEGPGGIIGAVIGAFLSIGNCPCDDNPCQYAVYVSTPDVCYNQYSGLTFQVAGYGNTTNGFRFELYKSDNLSVANQLAVHATSNNYTTFSDAELQGNTAVYIYVATNCGSGSLNYQPASTQINIPFLGQPSFTMTGNTNPYTTAYEGYNLVGRNIQNTSWHIYTHGSASGSFINQSNTNAVVQWNSSPGYIYLAADAHTDCGDYYGGLDVYTRNY